MAAANCRVNVACGKALDKQLYWAYEQRGLSCKVGCLGGVRFLALVLMMTFVLPTYSYGNLKYPLTQVVSLFRGIAELPCDIKTSDPEDQVRLVLWYREDLGTPIYSIDTRDAELDDAERWSDDHVFGQRATFRSDRRVAALIVTNLKKTDEGLYRCRVDFRRAQTRNVLLNLTVIVPARRPAIFDEKGVAVTSSVIVEEGQPLSLLCESTAGRPLPSVVWKRDNLVMDASFEATPDGNGVHNALRLDSVERKDLHAVLVCEASNSNLTQPTLTSVSIDMLLRPLESRMIGVDQPLSAQKEATVTCLIRGSRPPPSVSWLLDDHVLGHGRASAASANSNETVATIKFIPRPDDGGRQLKCRARNPNLTLSSDEFVEDAQTITVYYRPHVVLSLGSNLQATNIKEGDDVYFDCRVTAFPTVSRLEWYHNDKKLWHNISAGVIITNQSLVLQKVGRSSGGRYRCLAINREGETESETLFLDVKYAPLCKVGQSRVYGIARHEEARITCDLDANPVSGLQFRWAFNSSAGVTELPPATWSFDATHSVARYLPSSDLDFGSLLCWASNSVGTQAIPCVFHVIPADKPDPVSNCSVSHQSAEALTITCTEGFSGGLPQLFLMEMSSSQDQILRTNITAAKPTFTVRGLDHDTPYVFHVYATNAKGRSSPSSIRVMTLRQPEIQHNTESERPRFQPSSTSGVAISPLVAVISGAVSALLLLAVLLVIALRLRCRAAGGFPGAGRSQRAGTETSRLSRDLAPVSACSETLLLGKGDRDRDRLTAGPPTHVNEAADDRNPDIIPHEGEILDSGLAVSGIGAPPLAALLADLPPPFACTRQLSSMLPAVANNPGHDTLRWRHEAMDFRPEILPNLTSTLPRNLPPTWAVVAVPPEIGSIPSNASKKESSV